MAKYFDDLSLKDMIKYHDFTYMMADDHRYWKGGLRQMELINEKVKAQGGWTKELVDHWNKYAPGDENSPFKREYYEQD
jgi:hypothetical protein